MYREVKIIVLDIDGVLTDIKSSWELIHKAFGVDNKNNLKKYLKGEISYKEFMRRDIDLWGRVHISCIRRILDRAPLMKGAKETIHELRKAGYGIAIISAGVSILAERLKKGLEIDYVYSNKLLVNKDGTLTGEGEAVVCLSNKVQALKDLTTKLGITTKQCAVVGDSIYDIPLFEISGFSIAFNTEDKTVKKSADVIIENKDLREILPYFIPKKKRNQIN